MKNSMRLKETRAVRLAASAMAAGRIRSATARGIRFPVAATSRAKDRRRSA